MPVTYDATDPLETNGVISVQMWIIWKPFLNEVYTKNNNHISKKPIQESKIEEQEKLTDI